jgi:hypothetical protein
LDVLIKRPYGAARCFFGFSRHFVPGYLHWVPPAFVQPFPEKLRRRVDYGGEAGTIFGNKINPQITRNGAAFSALLI